MDSPYKLQKYKVLITQPFFELQILHGSSYGLSDQIKKYKSTLKIKVQKYRSTNVQKYKNIKNINSTKIQKKTLGCQLRVQKNRGVCYFALRTSFLLSQVASESSDKSGSFLSILLSSRRNKEKTWIMWTCSVTSVYIAIFTG